jgi:hypothetical protein
MGTLRSGDNYSVGIKADLLATDFNNKGKPDPAVATTGG